MPLTWEAQSLNHLTTREVRELFSWDFSVFLGSPKVGNCTFPRQETWGIFLAGPRNFGMTKVWLSLRFGLKWKDYVYGQDKLVCQWNEDWACSTPKGKGRLLLLATKVLQVAENLSSVWGSILVMCSEPTEGLSIIIKKSCLLGRHNKGWSSSSSSFWGSLDCWGGTKTCKRVKQTWDNSLGS